MTGWLTDTLLYTGLLIALVLLVRRPVARLFGPKLAYALWLLPALRLVLPPVVLPADLAPQQAQLSDQALLALAMAAQASSTPAPPPMPLWERPVVLLPLWLGGAALFLAWRIASYLKMRRELLAGARTVGQAGPVRLVETPAVSSPVAFGVRDKVVALPPAFMALEDRAARDLAIAHELAHHRGHDIVANFAAQPLLALHWFNPVAWLGWRAMRRDQEAACDARVLEGRAGEERAAYARLIAGFAAGPRLALAAPMACPIIGEKSIIHRLRSLSMSDVSPTRRRLGRLLLAGGALALPFTASVSYATAQEQPLQTTDVPPSAAAQPAADSQPGPLAGPQPDPQPSPRVRTVVLKHEDAKDAGAQRNSRVEKRVQRFELRHEPDGAGPDGDLGPGEHRVFTMRIDGPLTPEQKKHLEQMRKEMEKQGDWKERSAELKKMQQNWAEMAKNAPEVSADCDQTGGAISRDWTDSAGRHHIAVCKRVAMAYANQGESLALMNLKAARATIAGNSAMSDSVRSEVLGDLDKEIARLEAKP